MSYAGEHIIAALKAAREELNLSQRAMSAKTGVPQSHISKIENGAVDIQLSSLIELARVLGLELTLVPRRLVPAVQAILRSGETATSRQGEATWKAVNELKRIQHAVKQLKPLPEWSEPLQRIQKTAEELAKFPLGNMELKTIQAVAAKIKHIEQDPKTLRDIKRAAQELKFLRNHLVRGVRELIPAPRPAYSLNAEDYDA
jgi:transcriptional regulator with XRE-family HTH domain